jgi:NADPH-dependent ferric siderophore reductase
MDIDFVIHDGDGVPGASWALNARPGDKAGLIGPGGGGVPESRNLVLAGDETALPAIARIAAAMPSGAKLQVLLEVEDGQEEQPLFTAASHEITWFHRKGRPAGTTGTLERALRGIVTRTDPSAYIWAACEQSEARAIRNFMKTEIQYDQTRFSVAAYWQKCAPVRWPLLAPNAAPDERFASPLIATTAPIGVSKTAAALVAAGSFGSQS